jgi:hypothetical protein
VKGAIVEQQPIEARREGAENSLTKSWKVSVLRAGSSRKKLSPVRGSTAP